MVADPDGQGWPTVARMDYSDVGGRAVPPCSTRHDAGVWIGDVAALDFPPMGVDAVVSLCRLGPDQSPAPRVAAADHVEVWLIDVEDRAENPHLEFVLHDTVRTIAELRAQGRTVLLHCVASESRTPTVAALYGAHVAGITAAHALDEVKAVLPQARPNPTFAQVLGNW